MSPINQAELKSPVSDKKQLPIVDLSSSHSSVNEVTHSVVPTYWRSLEHLAGSPELESYLGAEFPGLREAVDGYDRRGFLRLLGASMALAGITSTGCRRWPVEEIRPHTSRPVGFAPGVAVHYATLFELNGVATGILAKSYDGRPIKIEGNPDHPMSLGAASAFAQASVLDLYDPDRSRQIWQQVNDSEAKLAPKPVPVFQQAESEFSNRGTRRKWSEFEGYAQGLFGAHRARQGDGLAILMQGSSSPTQRRLLDELKNSMPKARWFTYQPLHFDQVWEGSRAAFGRSVRCQYDLTKARTILCFDADLLGAHPAHLKWSRDWSAGRRSVDSGKMNRLIAIEAGWTLTGSVADERIALPPSQVELAVQWIAARLGVLPTIPAGLDEATGKELDAIATTLMVSSADSVAIAGPSLSPLSHQLVHAINERLGAVGVCVVYTHEPLSDDNPDGYLGSIRQLSELLQGNALQTLLILEGNPVYDVPIDAPLDLRSSSSRPLVSIHLSSHDNETSQACTWHVPAAHPLECWGDGQAWDGTYSLGQPLILPLYDGKSSLEMLSLVAGKVTDGSRSLVKETFSQLFPKAGAKGWELALHNGVQAGSAFEVISTSKPTVPASLTAKTSEQPRDSSSHSLEVQFVADAKVHDGRFANNAWLQELPEPVTKLTWDNAAIVSKSDADALHVTTGDLIRIENALVSKVSIEIPVLVMPGQAIGCVTVPLGYGRTHAGRIGNDIGANAFRIRDSQQSYCALHCTVTKTGKKHMLATTQLHHLVDSIADFALQKRLGGKGQPGLLVHEILLDEFIHDPQSVHRESNAVHAAPLFDQPNLGETSHQWAMSIDLNACIGCSNCIVACQAENNIPVVGRENVARNREMHWLRIDRYFKGDVKAPDMVHVPTACAHCENAPCEQVCPVAATVHDSEGLNAMIYNRCIGTRYCANNCPLKVRRFNYFDFHATDPREPAKPWLGIPDQQPVQDISTLKKMVHNPEVTVRMRGVMEKCTYCVQRIAEARITAKNEFAQGARDSDVVRDGEVKTACQATCPTQAIVFGDLNDPNSAVSRARHNTRAYEMLAELNLGARTTYLAKIRNRDT